MYSHATLVITADWSPDGSGGLFPQHTVSPDYHTEGSHQFYQIDRAGKLHTIYAFENMIIDHAAKGVYPCIQRYNTRKLGDRAWCVQERALALRIIHFCNVEILRECRFPNAAFCVCGAIAGTFNNDFAVGPSHFNNRLSRHSKSENPAWYYAKAWREIVHTYTRRDLTYGTDRLSAISALVRRFPISDSMYIAGMWHTKYMSADLAWYNIKGFDKDHPPWPVKSTPQGEGGPGLFDRLPQDYAPGWSWASIVAPVNFEFEGHLGGGYEWDILDVSYTLASPDPFGPGSSVTMTL